MNGLLQSQLKETQVWERDAAFTHLLMDTAAELAQTTFSLNL